MNRKLLILLTVLACIYCSASAQDKQQSKFNISTDLVSRYIWRGLDYGKAPAIHPTFSFISGGFEIGSWGSLNTTGNYSEVDLYAKYTLKGITAAFTDYFVHNEAFPNNTRYFNYNSKTTTHIFEPSLQYKGPDKFPISLLVATYVYGNDRAWGYDIKKDTTGENYYSTYIELGYTFKLHKNPFELFIGITPKAGAYGNDFGVVNAGINGYKTIAITDKFSIPVKASIIGNPQAENLYFVITLTL